MTELMEYKFRHGENKARLRPIARRDWEKVVGWWNDPEVKRLFDVHFVDQTFADAEKWFSRTNSPDDEKHARSFIIEVFHENNWIGVGTAEFYNERPSHKTAEFGFLIGEMKWWGQGIGTETAKKIIQYGFKTLKYHRIGAVSAAYNVRSLNALQKAGFQIEGVRKGYVWRDGEYHDQIMMSVLDL
jgi:RimJ/RimL family protein N-acetyltransferase